MGGAISVRSASTRSSAVHQKTVPKSGLDLKVEDAPNVLAFISIYGKRTDRDARVEVTTGWLFASVDGATVSDVRIATEQPVDFAVGILSAVLTSATFMGVLWTVGGNLTIAANPNPVLFGRSVTISGRLRGGGSGE